MSQDAVSASLEIRPEPTEEEAAVIVAALATLSAVTPPAPVEDAPNHAKPSKWMLVGRRNAHHSSPHARKQWSRDLAWLERIER